jgi:carbon-monoxide dehydrogenase medium subunit
MKPARFSYHAPTQVEEALAILAGDPEAKILAGGQSLVPAMNFRLARPATLVDINRLPDLAGVSSNGSRVRIGALTRHRVFETPVVDGPLGPLLSRIAHHIGHLPIRVRGTFGGSLAHADPAAEWCLVAATLDAEIVARRSEGQRSIPAGEFFDTVFTTALQPDELLVEIRLPLLDGTWRLGFEEFSRRAGDFALVMALAALRLENGTVTEARLGIGGAGDRPVRLPQAEGLLVGQAPSEELFREVAETAARGVTPFEDIHASVEYRRDLVRAMTARALRQAVA